MNISKTTPPQKKKTVDDISADKEQSTDIDESFQFKIPWMCSLLIDTCQGQKTVFFFNIYNTYNDEESAI